MRGDSQRMEVTLHVKTNEWERKYDLNSWMSGIDKSFVRVLSPARVKDQGFLKVETRLWNYLPTAERTILIPPSLMLEDFMGSDFSNDDFVKMSYIARDYTHTFLKEETVDGLAAYKIELLPKENAPVVYGKLLYWVREQDAAPLKIEFYSDRLEHLKTLRYSDFKLFSGREYPSVWNMVNHKDRGNVTTITIHDAEFDVPIDPDVFTRRNLENPK
jgi:outer membrane lipoprotein-sorting protein